MKSKSVYLIDAVDAALNAGNGDAALACFADDTQIDTHIGKFAGKDGARTFINTLVSVNFHVESEARQVSGEKVSWVARISADPWKEAGVPEVVGQTEAVVRGGRIVIFKYVPDPEYADKLG